MINAKEKSFTREKLGEALMDEKCIQGLPKYIAYKAALLREKLVLSYVLAIVSSILVVYFVISRIEVYNMGERLRKKEYILAPGVQDFTPAVPDSIPDSYVHDAVSDFISSLGNINSSNIIEEYNGLQKFMSDEFKVKFELETRKWIDQVISEDIAQILKITKKNIISNQNGRYKVTVFTKVDFFSSGQFLANEDQVIEMELRLTAPNRHRRWYLEIMNITWSKLESFHNKEKYKYTTERK